MDLFDDYQDEMDGLDSQQIEAILSGRDPDDPVAERASVLIGEVRRALLEEPSPEVAARHLAAMEAARDEAAPGRAPGPAPRRKKGVRLLTRRRVAALGLAATLVLGAGIAAAIALPDRADDKTREVVPEDAPPDAAPPEDPAGGASEHGDAVSGTARDTSVGGCEKGQAVSGVASAKASEHRRDQAERPDPCAQAGQAPTGPARSGGSGGGGSGTGSGGDSGSGGPPSEAEGSAKPEARRAGSVLGKSPNRGL